MQKNDIKVYEPGNTIKRGYRSIISEIFEELMRNKWLIYQLIKRDILAMHKQSYIGLLWVFIMPIISVATFIILRNSGVLNVGHTGVPYPVYAITGLIFWQFFSTGLVAATNSLTEAGQMIKIVNFSKKSLVIASIGKALVAFAVQFVVILPLLLAYHIPVTRGVFLAALAAVPILVMTVGFGFILSLLNSVVRDVVNMLTIGVTFLMFLTPVLYVRPSGGFLYHITRWNPLYYLVDSARNLILCNHVTHMNGFIVSSLFSMIVLVFCIVVFHLTETRITERV